MSGSEIYRLLLRIRSDLGGMFDAVNFKEDISVLTSGTRYNEYELLFYVGVKELVERPDDEYPIGAAMIPVVSVFHEVGGHGNQIYREFEKDCLLSRVLALNYYACRDSQEYYGDYDDGVDDKYYRHPHEIAAQYMGIKLAFTYLSAAYGEKDASDMVCAYVDWRIANESECVRASRPYRSVDTILKDFDREFKRSVFEHRAYDGRTRYAADDVLHHGMPRQAAAWYSSCVERCSVGARQDLMMTSVFVERYDQNNLVKNKSAFRGLTLNPDEVFRRFSRPPISKVQRRSLSLRDLQTSPEVLNWSSTPRDGPLVGADVSEPPKSLESRPSVRAAIAAAEAVSDPEDESQVEY